MELKHEHDASGIRRIYVSEDTLLPPSQQTEVNVRVARRAPQSLAFTLLENDKVSGLRHDIGRIDLVEYRIDTGESRPIRRPLRRHPFQHLEWIDKEVEEMKKHGILEPATSPWASNVVLVKKKDGTCQLRVCGKNIALKTKRGCSFFCIFFFFKHISTIKQKTIT